MARIPDSELDRLKSEVSLVELAEARGVELKRKGADLHGRCPFHDDRTPSLVISPEKNLWNCLGACQTGGSVIDWVMKAEGVSFRHAVELLRTGLPSLVASPGDTPEAPRSQTPPKLSPLASDEVEDRELFERVIRFYHQTLTGSPEAREYLASRGLDHPDLVETFRLGFANRTLGYKLPDGRTAEGSALRGRLRELGILRESGHEHLRGSLTVPLFDGTGAPVQMYGRKISKDLRKGTALHLYLPGPQRGVFNLAGIRGQEEVILCESILDALTFWAAGLENVTTSFGVGGPNPETWEALEEAGTQRVLIAYDRDEAGERGARKLAEKLQEKGIAPYRVQFPKGMDANEYARKVTPAARSLALVVQDAIWMGRGDPPQRDLAEQLGVQAAATKGEVADQIPGSPLRPDISSSPLPASTSSPLRPDISSSPPPASTPGPLRPNISSSPPLPSDISSSPPVSLAPGDIPLRREGETYWADLGDRTYRIRDLLTSPASSLRVNLLVSRPSDLGGRPSFHVDTLDLYLDKPRCFFAKRAAQELGSTETVIRQDLTDLLLLLESERERVTQRADEEEPMPIAEDEQTEALELLRDPRLLERILEDFTRCGVVGEETNKLVGYLAAVSRKLEAPLAIVIQSSSAAGKSSLMDSILAFMPEEERVTYSAMTGQSLFYMSEENLRHRILAIAEEEGAQRASYALKLLQSEGELTIASTGKDPATGRLVTQEYRVEGPVMIFLTTTAVEMDEELLNRCLVLTVDEGREQTRAIHKLQRERQTLEGLLLDKEEEHILRRHQNAQRLLDSLLVANPFAHELTFLDHRTRMRRDHMKYLTLIRSIALLHQHQREVKVAETRSGQAVRYVEVTREDIRIANHLAQEVLGRSLDELPPQTRRLLEKVVDLVDARSRDLGCPRDEVRFTRRDIREYSGVGNTQAKVHLGRLEDLEYLLVHSGGRGQSIVYELLYEPPEEEPARLPGLLDLGEATSDYRYDPEWSGAEGERSGPSRPQVGPVSAPGRGEGPTSESRSSRGSGKATKRKNSSIPEKALPGAEVSPVVAVPPDKDAA